MNVLADLAQQAAAAAESPPAATPAALAALAAVLFAIALPSWLYAASRVARGQAVLPFEERLPVSWWGADVLVIGAISVVLQLTPQVMLHLQGVELTTSGKLPPGSETTFLTAQCVAEICSLVFALWWLSKRAGADTAALGLTLRAWPRDLASGLVAATFIIPPISALQALLVTLFPSEHPLITTIKQSPGLLPLATLLAAVIAPLFEEFMFRVVLQGWLEKVELELRSRSPQSFSMPVGVLPILGSSLAFAAAHFHHGADPLPLFLLALVLGYFYRQTHRIWPSLVVHAGLNGMSTAILWLTVLQG